MKNMKTLAALTALPVLAIGFVGTQLAFAQSDAGTSTPTNFVTRFTQMFENQASLIGASPDEVKQAWAEGKSLQDLAAEKGISSDDLKAKMQAQRLEKEKSMLDSLVSAGVITQAQADTRLAAIQNGTVHGGFGEFGHPGPHGPPPAESGN